MAPQNETRLERFNVVLSLEDSEWLTQLTQEIHAESGSRVTRSEIIRAAIAGLRELHRLAPTCPGRFLPLHTCKLESELAMMAVLAVRHAVKW